MNGPCHRREYTDSSHAHTWMDHPDAVIITSFTGESSTFNTYSRKNSSKEWRRKKRNSARHELKRLSLCVWLWYMIHIIRWTRAQRKNRVSATTFRRSLVADWEWWLKADAFSFFFPFICMTQTQWCGRCAVVKRFYNFTDEDDEGETWHHASSEATIL